MTNKASDKAFDYAAKMAELEAVLAQLQASDTPLDDAMTLHETGTNLIAELEEFLKHAEHDIQKHVAKDA